MSPWLDSPACRNRAHCRDCRTDAAWGAKVGVPAICPHGFTPAHLPIRGLGDLLERAVKPIAKLLKLPCLEKNGSLKPQSKCAKRRAQFNALTRP